MREQRREAARGLRTTVGPADAGSTRDSGSTTSDAGELVEGGVTGDRCSPATLHLTVRGFLTCSCFNGTFTLTKVPADDPDATLWASAAITGCPDQDETPYLQVLMTNRSTVSFGITNATSEPGSGDSDYSPATTTSCAPSFEAAGGGSQAGNTTGSCDNAEDEDLTWSVGP